MFELIISDIHTEGYVSEFSVDCTPYKNDNDFTDFNGDKAGEGDCGDTITLNAELKRVPAELSQRLASALSGGTVEVAYTNPAVLSSVFRKKKFVSKSRTKGESWDISLTLESAAPVGGSRL